MNSSRASSKYTLSDIKTWATRLVADNEQQLHRPWKRNYSPTCFI